MLKFNNTHVDGFDAALRGMRNPMNSWDKSDSRWIYDCEREPMTMEFVVGDADLALAQKLVLAGTEHAKFMRMIHVSVDITAPLYWWKEFDTYKVATVRNSCSTMHKIHAKEFTLEDFSCEKLFEGIGPGRYEDPKDCDCFAAINIDGDLCYYSPMWFVRMTCDILNRYRELFIKTKDKKYWYQMIQLLPSSYNQMATVDLSYATLRQMYFQRRNHKLDEWSVDFMNWLSELPYSHELIMLENKGIDICENY